LESGYIILIVLTKSFNFIKPESLLCAFASSRDATLFLGCITPTC